MPELLRPVRYGILIGLLGLLFGMSWAVWLVVGHEKIHKSLEARMMERNDASALMPLLLPGNVHADTNGESGHSHPGEAESAGDVVPPSEGLHDDPILKEAHEKLRWAHVHYMGLGLLTIGLSLVLAFTAASNGVKGTLSILTGLGGVIYPFAWIVVGYRIPSMGEEAAEAFAAPIAGPGIALVFIGIVSTVFILFKNAPGPRIKK